jgi:hypothetical protein
MRSDFVPQAVSRAVRAVALLTATMLALATLPSCAYPRRSTSLSVVRAGGADTSSSMPADVWQLTIVSGQVPQQSRGAIGWDGTDGLPDPFVRVYRNDELVYETSTLEDTLTPEWNVTLPRNFYAPRDATLRFEMWDRDEVGEDPIGMYRNRGLPGNAVTDADARMLLDNGAQLVVRLAPAQAHRGLGINVYEVHEDALVVIEAETHSPAGRAGIVPGDAILAIGGQAVSALGPNRAPGALSMAGERHETLRVRNARGDVREIELDRGYTWLTM